MFASALGILDLSQSDSMKVAVGFKPTDLGMLRVFAASRRLRGGLILD